MEDDRFKRFDHFTQVIPVPSKDGQSVRSHQLAGSGGRFLAGAADLVIQVLCFVAIAWLTFKSRPDLFPRSAWAWAIPVGFIEWHIIYLMLFESFTRGQTPGKALVRLRVVTMDGQIPTAVAFVIRNIARLADIALGAYLGSLALISRTRRHQRLGDIAAHTLVIYREPLADQLQRSRVPESLYSTSEDGYLLQAWMTRELNLDDDSRMSSAVDLAAYLHGKYDGKEMGNRDPIAYLRQLYHAENAEEIDGSGGENEQNSTGHALQ
jgi:uncharacterized RDD family membrane protein YckC